VPVLVHRPTTKKARAKTVRSPGSPHARPEYRPALAPEPMPAHPPGPRTVLAVDKRRAARPFRLARARNASGLRLRDLHGRLDRLGFRAWARRRQLRFDKRHLRRSAARSGCFSDKIASGEGATPVGVVSAACVVGLRALWFAALRSAKCSSLPRSSARWWRISDRCAERPPARR